MINNLKIGIVSLFKNNHIIYKKLFWTLYSKKPNLKQQ